MSEPNRTPFQDITNTSTRTDANATNGDNLGTKPPSRNGWYARMTPEKRAEYLEKQRERRKQKKAAKVSDNSTTCQESRQGWYAIMTEEERAEYLEKQRIYRQKKKMAAVSGSSENVEMPGQSSQRVSPGSLLMVQESNKLVQEQSQANMMYALHGIEIRLHFFLRLPSLCAEIVSWIGHLGLWIPTCNLSR